MTFSDRIAQIPTSATLRAKLKALELKAKGIDVINLSAGEPSFPTPLKIKEACKAALDADHTRYGPVNGIAEMRRAIAGFLKRRNGMEVDPEQIVPSCGAKQGIFAALQVLINPGDEVILGSPYWVTYPPQILLAGGKPVIWKMEENGDFKLGPEELRKAITPKTKMLLLNTPSNPTGSCYTEGELKKLGEICAEKNIWVLSDEIYDQLVYDGSRHASFWNAAPFHREKTILANGASKSFAMTGWRVGYCAGPLPFIEKLKILQGQVITSLPTFIQHACVTAFNDCDEELDRMRKAFESRRNLCHDLIRRVRGLRCHKPKGAFYLFPEVTAFPKTSEELAAWLLEDAHVSVVAGDSFGAPGFLRVSFVGEEAELKEGVERIKTALEKLK